MELGSMDFPTLQKKFFEEVAYIHSMVTQDNIPVDKYLEHLEDLSAIVTHLYRAVEQEIENEERD